MLYALFLKHPRALGETYAEHQRRALGVAGTMLIAGSCCAAHAIVPALFENTASAAINRLHERFAGGGTPNGDKGEG